VQSCTLTYVSLRIDKRMRFITCFGAVADDAETAAPARRSGIQKQRWNLASSFRRKLLSSGSKRGKKTKKPSQADEKARDSDAEYSLYGGASTASSSAPSSPPLSSESSPRPSSSAPQALPPRTPKQEARRAAFPVTGVAAFVLCLLMVVLCGKVVATLLTSAALYLLPQRRSPVHRSKPRCGLRIESKEEAAKKIKVGRKGFFGRNRMQ
jgi:hypothetical protein